MLCGAGYNVERVDPYAVVGFGTDVKNCCCCVNLSAKQTTVGPYGATSTPIDRTTAPKFDEAMTWATRSARDLKPDELVVERSFQFTYRCGLSVRTLKIHRDGFVSIQDSQGDCCSCNRRTMTGAAFLEQLEYIKYTTTPLVGFLLCCSTTGIELAFEGNVYTMQAEVNWSDLQELYRVLLHTTRQGKPSEASQTFPGAFGSSVTVAPDFVTITYRPWYACLCPFFSSTSVVTVRTDKVAYVKASMASCSNACAGAWEETAEPWFEMKKACHRACTDDLETLISWPCSMVWDLSLASNLFFQSVIICLIFPFYALCAVCCRRSGVVIGSPGPKPRVIFPGIDEPEAFTSEVATAVEKAQAEFSWPHRSLPRRMDIRRAVSTSAAPALTIRMQSAPSVSGAAKSVDTAESADPEGSDPRPATGSDKE